MIGTTKTGNFSAIAYRYYSIIAIGRRYSGRDLLACPKRAKELFKGFLLS